MQFKFAESVVEEACLQYFGQLGYAYRIISLDTIIYDL